MHQSFRMIDVGAKAPTRRVAVAQGTIEVGSTVFALIRDRALPKGDALTLAEIAGIQGAKRASDTIPLCHPLPLDQVRLTHSLDEAACRITVFCFVVTQARTGVEMEALAGVSSALLAIYDLAKMIEPALTIGDIRLVVKTGGKHGVWICPQGAPDWIRQELGLDTPSPLIGYRAAVVTVSDRAARGTYQDLSGAALREALERAGAEIAGGMLVPDDEAAIIQAVRDLIDRRRPHLILTTGGTGVGPRDMTPEAIRRLTGREVPGLGELLRQSGAQFTPHSWSSRSLAAMIGDTLVVTLPGHPEAAGQGLDRLLPLLPHLFDMMAGKPHDRLPPSP